MKNHILQINGPDKFMHAVQLIIAAALKFKRGLL